MVRSRFTIDDIRSKYSEEKKISDKNNLWGYFVLRRISYYLTWIFLRLGISADQVTGISLIIGSLGCIFLASKGYRNGNTIIGALLVNIWALLDYVDGNIARFNNSCSKCGEFFDALTGYTVGTLLFFSVGIGVFNHPDSSLSSLLLLLGADINKSMFLIFGCCASLFFISKFLIVNKFAILFQLKKNDIIGLPKSNILYKIGFNLSVLSGLVMPILLIFTVLGSLSIFVSFYAIINASALIITLILFVKRAVKIH